MRSGSSRDAAQSDTSAAFDVLGVAYPSIYVQDHAKAAAFYSRIFGTPEYEEEDEGLILGWRLGDTWLTLFESRHGRHPGEDVRNAEIALRLARPEQVDRLFETLIDAGAQALTAPLDTWMYEPMRYATVDDPFGLRLDLFCPIDPGSNQTGA